MIREVQGGNSNKHFKVTLRLQSTSFQNYAIIDVIIQMLHREDK